MREMRDREISKEKDVLFCGKRGGARLGSGESFSFLSEVSFCFSSPCDIRHQKDKKEQ